MIRVLIALMLISFNALALDMNNTITLKGEGGANPDYGKKIKNIMIFHSTAAGWWYKQESVKPHWTSTWPLNWGKGPSTYSDSSDQGYLFRSKEVYLQQMKEIQELGGTTAVAVFLMPDDEAGVAGDGYGSYWTPTGQWRRPKASFDEVRWAAWQKGLHVAPFISLNDYRNKGPSSILGELKKLVDFAMQRVDGISLKTTDGKVVILIEGLPSETELYKPENAHYAAEINQYLASRTDILWIDNLVNNCPTTAPNIYRSAATSNPNGQDALKNNCGGRYLWHYTNRSVEAADKTPGGITYLPMDVQLEWLNITPHNPNMYPVVISQWNEYTEWKMFEPSEYDGTSEYDYLKWRMTQQP